MLCHGVLCHDTVLQLSDILIESVVSCSHKTMHYALLLGKHMVPFFLCGCMLHALNIYLLWPLAVSPVCALFASTCLGCLCPLTNLCSSRTMLLHHAAPTCCRHGQRG